MTERDRFERAYALKWRKWRAEATGATDKSSEDLQTVLRDMREDDHYGEERNHLNFMWEGWQLRDVIERTAGVPVPLKSGGSYAGPILNSDGTPEYYLILLPGDVKDINWSDAMAWAKEQGGELPTHREQSLLFANLSAQFQPAWYWSGEPRRPDSCLAGYQGFDTGYQDFTFMGFEGRARAVRRVYTATAGRGE